MSILPGEWTELESIGDSRQDFDSRFDIGASQGVIDRLLRFLQGNPIAYARPSSANFSSPATLPRNDQARTAQLQVINAACFYRTDGSQPLTNNEQTLPVGTNVTLIGQETIQGFTFIATGIQACTIAVTYYD